MVWQVNIKRMIKAIFYKEFIKCRAVLSVLLIIAVALVAYMFIGNANLMRTSGAVSVWAQIADGGFSLLSSMMLCFMPIAAIAIAVMQYSLEMANKRFKLTLHLPVPEVKIVATMQSFGIAMLVALYVVLLLPSYIGLSVYYPVQLMCAMFVSAVPYMLAGFAAYFFTMWIVVEPTWKRRAAYLLIAAGAMSPFAIETMLGGAVYAIPAQILIVAAAIVSSFYAATRFKNGAQD